MYQMMNAREKILLSFAILIICSLLFFVVFGENGLVDLDLLKQERTRLIEKNKKLEQENLALYREIDRLKNDLKYIENVARQELGMVKEEEVIIKLQNRPPKN